MEQTIFEVDQTLVKEEWMEDEPEMDIELDANSESRHVSVDPTIKCGEIFLQAQGRNFTFICAVCSNPFESLESFGQHVEFHLENDKKLGCSRQDPLAYPLLFPHLNLVQENDPPIELVDVKAENDFETEKTPEKPVFDRNLIENKSTGCSSTEIRKFSCPKCDRTYKHQRSLQSHIKKNHKEELPCRFCDRTYHSLNALRVHEETDHGLEDPNTNPAVSPKANKFNDDQAELKPHCESNNAASSTIILFEEEDLIHRKSIDCPRCDGMFDDRRSLLIHVRCEHGLTVLNTLFDDEVEEKFPCKLCDRSYRHFESLDLHEKDEHWAERLDQPSSAAFITVEPKSSGEKKFACKFCDRTYTRRQNLRLHTKIYHCEGLLNANELTCRYCNKTFPTKYECNVHATIEHPGTNKFPCPHCPKFFRHPNSLKDHIYMHTGEKPFKCHYCSKDFARQAELRVHQMRVHMQIKNHKCTFCSKAFVTRGEKTRHEQMHTGERPHQCDECGARFLTSQRLKQHLDRHRNIKNYKCNICDKKFFTKKSLQDHDSVHSSERPYSCTVCEQSFPRKRALQVHEQLHSDVKKYVCNVCGKAFAQCAGLYYHKKTHRSSN